MGRTYLHLIWAALTVMAIGAGAARAEDRLDPFSSRGHGLAFAIDEVCMPYLRRGGVVAALAGVSGVASELDGRPAVRLHGFGRVRVAADPATRGCVIVTRNGDGRHARDEVLQVLEAGYLLETLVGPNEATLHGRRFTGLAEAYCFRLDERVVEADLSTSRDQDPDDPAHGDALRLRLYWSDAEAAKKGVCKA